jgi:hypothetical protein
MLDPIPGDAAPAQRSCVTHRIRSQGDVAGILVLWRIYSAWLKARVRLELQAQALCRSYCGGDKDAAKRLWQAALKGQCADPDVMFALMPFIESVEAWNAKLKPIRKDLERQAKRTPHYHALAGDIASYRNPSCLWKRMGLAVIDGERQRKCTDKQLATIHGYAPQRRAVMFVVSACIVRAKEPLKQVYEDRKAQRLKQGWSKLRAHRDAMRFVAKRLLRALWHEARANNDCYPAAAFAASCHIQLKTDIAPAQISAAGPSGGLSMAPGGGLSMAPC